MNLCAHLNFEGLDEPETDLNLFLQNQTSMY